MNEPFATRAHTLLLCGPLVYLHLCWTLHGGHNMWTKEKDERLRCVRMRKYLFDPLFQLCRPGPRRKGALQPQCVHRFPLDGEPSATSGAYIMWQKRGHGPFIHHVVWAVASQWRHSPPPHTLDSSYGGMVSVNSRTALLTDNFFIKQKVSPLNFTLKLHVTWCYVQCQPTLFMLSYDISIYVSLTCNICIILKCKWLKNKTKMDTDVEVI